MNTVAGIPFDQPVSGILAGAVAEVTETTQTEVDTAVKKMTDASELVNKTVFLKTRFRMLGTTRKVSGNDVLETDADMSLLKVSKTLLNSPELGAIKKADGAMRKWLYNTCLPFDMGIMLLPIGLVEKAEERMTQYRGQREELVDKFIAAYPALCEQAIKQLGSLYMASEYPTVDKIRAKFSFDWQYVRFSVPGHLKNISAVLFETEKEKYAAKLKVAQEEITAVMRESMLKLVSHLQERLKSTDDGKAKILKESAVKNLTEFLESFDLRNVTDDSDLEELVNKARGLVTGRDASQLRNSDELRTKVLSGLDSIMDSLSGLVEEKPGRKFKEEDE